MKVNLWHRPYNGGWVYFDRKQVKRWRCGWGHVDYNHVGEREVEPVLWWCFFGFCGRITIQSWPWQKNPATKRATMSDTRGRE